jgi:hypothetical protein
VEVLRNIKQSITKKLRKVVSKKRDNRKRDNEKKETEVS